MKMLDGSMNRFAALGSLARWPSERRMTSSDAPFVATALHIAVPKSRHRMPFPLVSFLLLGASFISLKAVILPSLMLLHWLGYPFSNYCGVASLVLTFYAR